jgi:hypothetical protein
MNSFDRNQLVINKTIHQNPEAISITGKQEGSNRGLTATAQ